MFQIDSMSRQPVYEQIIVQMERFILSGALKAGDQIPSVRNVALTHSINPRTILKAYSDLDTRGLIQSVPGKGYFVCRDALEVLEKKNMDRLQTLSTVLSEMAMAGVPMHAVIQCVEETYRAAEKGEGQND